MSSPEYLLPFTRMVNLHDGIIPEAVLVQTRRLSDLKGLFADSVAETALIAENPVLYQVYEATDNPTVVGQLRYSTTVIYPGKVGDEYYMTKGHYHAIADRAELYFCLAGEGYLLLQTPDGDVTNAQRMTPGAASYVPPYWGHRTMNTGKTNFVFLAVYPADAGYDYAAIAEKGFASIIVERDGALQVVANPRFHK
jgi:glucose-6-phosphate isomerase